MRNLLTVRKIRANRRRPGGRAPWVGLLAAIAVLLAAATARPAEEHVPAPAAMAAEVIVSGRTSTAVRVDVARVGDRIPATFSGDALKNVPGFPWYVSRHFALRTDYAEEKARHLLTVLEMAWPHYVELFGREPEGLAERRLAVCYATSRDALRRVLAADGMRWDFAGGGITFEQRRCAYVYPSGTLEYHRRYILLHECMHLYQQCLVGTCYTTPWWFYEGIADSLAGHVYDSENRRATFHVLDKPTTHDHFDEGKRALAEKPLTARQIHEAGEVPRGVAFLLAHFLLDDPGRLQRLRIWRDEMLRRAPKKPISEGGRLIENLFGSWDTVNADFQRWLDDAHNTFHYAEWGWEQDADTLWSYGFAEGGRLSQTDVYLPAGEQPAAHPLRMDWPAQPASPLVVPAARGVDEPSVGCLLDFSRCPGRGVVGFGLGLVGDTPGRPDCLRILIKKGERLVLDGSTLGLGRKEIALPEALRQAAAAAGHRFGVTATVRREALRVLVRAGDPAKGALESAEASVPVTEPVRARLLSQPATLLSRDGWHGVTPYFDARRPEPPDLSVPAPPNRWRNPGDRALAALFEAAWRLGDPAPGLLVSLRDRLLAAAAGSPSVQQQALEAFEAALPRVLTEIEQCGAPEEARDHAADVLRRALG